jgi:hypothetical protein
MDKSGRNFRCSRRYKNDCGATQAAQKDRSRDEMSQDEGLDCNDRQEGHPAQNRSYRNEYRNGAYSEEDGLQGMSIARRGQR